MITTNKPIVLGYWDAIEFLNITQSYFDKIVKKDLIPYQQTSSWKIFFKEDLEKFNESRKEKSKSDKRIKISKR